MRENLSRGAVSTVDTEVCTGHERAAFGQEEDGRGLEVLGCTQALEKGSPHPSCLNLRLGLQKLIGHCGPDVLLMS